MVSAAEEPATTVPHCSPNPQRVRYQMQLTANMWDRGGLAAVISWACNPGLFKPLHALLPLPSSATPQPCPLFMPTLLPAVFFFFTECIDAVAPWLIDPWLIAPWLHIMLTFGSHAVRHLLAIACASNPPQVPQATRETQLTAPFETRSEAID